MKGIYPNVQDNAFDKSTLLLVQVVFICVSPICFLSWEICSVPFPNLSLTFL